MRTLAVVGADGVGKSTLLRALADDAARQPGLVVMPAPCYHEHPQAPHRAVSKALEAMATCCDMQGGAAWKALALYLQMTLFGPVQRGLVDVCKPECLLHERHAVVDSLVYANLYGPMLKHAGDSLLAQGETFRRQLDLFAPGAWALINDWCRHLTAQPSPHGMATLVRELCEVAAQDPEQQCAHFMQRYHVDLPDVLIWLDAPVDVLWKRIVQRGDVAREWHETQTRMHALRLAYENVVSRLAQEGLCVERLAVGNEPPVRSAERIRFLVSGYEIAAV